MKIGDNILARIELFVRKHVTKEFLEKSGWTGSLEFYAPVYVLEQLKPIFQSWIYLDADKLSVSATRDINTPTKVRAATQVKYFTNPNLDDGYIHAHLYHSSTLDSSMMVPIVWNSLESLEKDEPTYWNF